MLSRDAANELLFDANAVPFWIELIISDEFDMTEPERGWL